MKAYYYAEGGMSFKDVKNFLNFFRRTGNGSEGPFREVVQD